MYVSEAAKVVSENLFSGFIPILIQPKYCLGAFLLVQHLVVNAYSGVFKIVHKLRDLRNVKSDKSLVVVKNGEEKVETGLKKFGAMLGDFVEVGCNSVLNPGTVIGRYSNVYPTSCVRGMIPEGHIWKNDGTVVKKI